MLTQYSYDKAGNRRVITDARSYPTPYEYDDLNRLIGITYSDSTPAVTFTYDNIGNRETMTTTGLGQTVYTYDKLYRLSSVIDWVQL